MARVVALSANPRNVELLAGALSADGHEVGSATTLEELDDELDGHAPIEIAVLDVARFDASLWQRCDRMKREQIAFLVVLPREDPRAKVGCHTRGALAVLVKPIAVRELLGVVECAARSG